MHKQLTLAAAWLLGAGFLHAQNNCTADKYKLELDEDTGIVLDLPYKGGITRAKITPAAGCTWAITSMPAWVTLLSGFTSGTTQDIVVFGVETNTATTERKGNISIGLHLMPLTQAAAPAGCVFTLQSPTDNVTALGKAGLNTINSTQPTCQWTSFANKNWLQLFPIDGTGTTGFSYTVFPNFSTGQRTAVGNVAAQDFSVIQAAATGNFNQRLVRLLYFNFLGRLPAPSEEAGHVQNLVNGMTPATLALNFMNTLEFNLGGRLMAGMYVGLLRRNAEFGGWLFQRNALATGGNQVAIVSNVINGQEYISQNGAQTNDQFVRFLYANVLLRQPSNTEVQAHVDQLNAGYSRGQKATDFLNSGEFRSGRGPRLEAFLLYATLLSRDPSPIELSALMQRIQTGTPLTTLIQEIMNTTEFAQSLS